MTSNQIQVACPVCMGCKHGAVANVIYCHCAKHSVKTKAPVVPQQRLVFRTLHPDLAEVVALQARWKTVVQQLTDTQYGLSSWKRHKCNHVIDCIGCNKVEELESEVAWLTTTEKSVRVKSLSLHEAWKENGGITYE